MQVRLSLVIPILVQSLLACASSNGIRSSKNQSPSVVAEVQGVADQDLKRNLKYLLLCDGQAAGPIAVEGKRRADAKAVEFPATNIKPQMSCLMEITIEAPEAQKLGADLGWEWIGQDTAGNPRVGLLYGTDRQPVKSDLSLQLTIWPTYRARPTAQDKLFALKIWAQFDADKSGVKVPEGDETVSLECDGTQLVGGIYKKPDATSKVGYLLFDKAILTTLKDKSCSRVRVLSRDKITFAADTPEIKLMAAAEGKTLLFPSDDGAKVYTLKPVINGETVVNTQDGGKCLSYAQGCTDVHEVTLPTSETFLAAKVYGLRAQDAQVVAFWVLPQAADGKLARYLGDKLSVKDLNDALKLGDQAALKLAWYRAQADAIMSAQFDADQFDDAFLSGASLMPAKASTQDLAGVQFLHLAQVYVHGFHKASTQDWTKKAKATWFAHVTASKAGTPNQQFLVTGTTKYFQSTMPPSGNYFDAATLAQDLAATTGARNYALYALSGQPMAQATCGLELKTYLSSAAVRTLSSGASAAFDACEIGSDNVDAALKQGGWTFAPQFYVWEWFRLGN